MRRFLKSLVRFLETHDCGDAADMYFCVDNNGKIIDGVGVHGFEECTERNSNSASAEFLSACKIAGGTVKGGCIDA